MLRKKQHIKMLGDHTLKSGCCKTKVEDWEKYLHELGYYLADVTQKMGIKTTIDVVVENGS